MWGLSYGGFLLKSVEMELVSSFEKPHTNHSRTHGNLHNFSFLMEIQLNFIEFFFNKLDVFQKLSDLPKNQMINFVPAV